MMPAPLLTVFTFTAAIAAQGGAGGFACQLVSMPFYRAVTTGSGKQDQA